MVLACGGGGGGGGGRNATGGAASGAGGASVFPYMQTISVVPNTTYTITIGTGGAGGAARTIAAHNPTNGNDTSFGTLAIFRGAQAAENKTWASVNGMFCTAAIEPTTAIPNPSTAYRSANPWVDSTITRGTAAGTYNGGVKGASGTTQGGNGGNGNNAGAGTAGTAGTANTGAGGGGGGAGSTAGGAGGAGGSGILTVIWIE